MRMLDDTKTIMPLQIAFGMKREGQPTVKGGTPFIGIICNLNISVLWDEDFGLVEFQCLGDEVAAHIAIIVVRGHGFNVSRCLQCCEFCIERTLSFQWRHLHSDCPVFEIEALSNFAICKAFKPKILTEHQDLTGNH